MKSNGFLAAIRSSADVLVIGESYGVDGCGIGKLSGYEGVDDLLLADAVRRVIEAARSLAVFAIVVEATDDEAATFYRDFGFAPFPNRPLRLFMPASEAAGCFPCAVAVKRADITSRFSWLSRISSSWPS